MPSYRLYRTIRFICFVILKVCCRFRVEGRENVPKEGAFIAASNHRSYLDPPALGAAIPQVLHFMARDDLFTVPILGPILKGVAVYPVKRGHQNFKAMKDSLKLLKEGNPIAIFPEGARIEGPGFGKPELGISMLAAHSGVPVVPVFIKGSREALPKHARFIRLRPVEARIGRPFRFEEHEGSVDRKQAYEEFGDKVMNSIAFLSQGVT